MRVEKYKAWRLRKDLTRIEEVIITPSPHRGLRRIKYAENGHSKYMYSRDYMDWYYFRSEVTARKFHFQKLQEKLFRLKTECARLDRIAIQAYIDLSEAKSKS